MTTNPRTAILKAADQIERNPELYDFGVCRIPKCGSPGCALGWIGYFAQMGGKGFIGVSKVANNFLSIENDVFYDRMDEISGDWIFCYKSCAQALIEYAHKYHSNG